MSLINDMLKDLEARKTSSGAFPGDMSQHRGSVEAISGRIDELRHADVTPPLERALRRRLPWLFWSFLLVLLGIALTLFLLRSGGMDAVTAAIPLPAEKAPPIATVANVLTPSTVDEKASDVQKPSVEAQPSVPPTVQRPAPRLVMLSAVAQGQGLRLDLAFDAALEKAVRLTREGERITLLLPEIPEAPLESPHPALRDWRSAGADEGWRMDFVWPPTADVRLQARKSGDGLQHWELVLASEPSSSPSGKAPEPSFMAGAEAPRAEAVRTPKAMPKPVPNLTPDQKAEALYAEAWQLQQKGRAELAMDKLRQAVQVQPEHARARELLVRLLLRAGQPQAAELELVRGLEAEPRQPELVELLARMLADQGRGQEALGLLRERMQPARLAHQSLFAVLAARAGQHAEAAEAYRRAAEIDPRDPRWPLGRAIALENGHQPAAAREAYAQALAAEGLDPASRAFAQERLKLLGQGG